MSSSRSIRAFFLSRAVCAATRFFIFLLISFSSGERWFSLCLFLGPGFGFGSKSARQDGLGRTPLLLLPIVTAVGFAGNIVRKFVEVADVMYVFPCVSGTVAISILVELIFHLLITILETQKGIKFSLSKFLHERLAFLACFSSMCIVY